MLVQKKVSVALMLADILFDEDCKSFVRVQSQHLVNYNHSANFESKPRQCVCMRPVCVCVTGDTTHTTMMHHVCIHLAWTAWAGHNTVSHCHTNTLIIDITNMTGKCGKELLRCQIFRRNYSKFLLYFGSNIKYPI